MKEEKKYYLGIDPGSIVLGYAIIEKNGALIVLGHLDLKGEEEQKYVQIFSFLVELIQKYPIEKMAVEKPFLGINALSLIKLSRVLGVILLCAGQHNIVCYQIPPTIIKQNITARGNADKKEIASILGTKYGFNKEKYKNDATDALAIALSLLHLILNASK